VTSSVSANQVRYRGQNKGFYEVYFVEAQDVEHRSGLWVRYTICAPKQGPAVAQLWAMYFDRDDPQAKRAFQKTIPIDEAVLENRRAAQSESSLESKIFRGLSFSIGDSHIDAKGCRGRIDQDDQFIEWDLSWQEDQVLVPFPFRWMYKAAFPKTKFFSPHWDARIDGSYACNAKKWTCSHDPGQQTHIWGIEHAHRWAWCHANTFENAPGLVFEALHAQIKIKDLHVPRFVFIGIRYEGEDYIFNQVSSLLYKNKSHFEDPQTNMDVYAPTKWTLECETEELRFRCELEGAIEHYLGVTYHDTDGRSLVCNHNKLTQATLQIFRKNHYGDWMHLKTFTSSSAALEFVGREPDPRIEVLIE
jgi:hypothetical protein